MCVFLTIGISQTAIRHWIGESPLLKSWRYWSMKLTFSYLSYWRRNNFTNFHRSDRSSSLPYQDDTFTVSVDGKIAKQTPRLKIIQQERQEVCRDWFVSERHRGLTSTKIKPPILLIIVPSDALRNNRRLRWLTEISHETSRRIRFVTSHSSFFVGDYRTRGQQRSEHHHREIPASMKLYE